jgi:thiol-disulfide isomerase/thioredoxin
MTAQQLALAALRASAVDDPVEAYGPPAGATGSASLDNAAAWLNSPPLSAADLRGRVVLVNFWTYTCINWLRTLPYIRAWSQRYRDHGLSVVGVHSPEFAFERDEHNVRAAVQRFGIDYPVALDPDHTVWRSFGNQYWPAVYLIDGSGRFRHHQFGEGEYAQSEMVIQRLLTEAGFDTDREMAPTQAHGLEEPADWASLGSAENYLGYGRAANFASPGDFEPDATAVYTVPERLRLNHWALAGTWRATRESVTAHEAEAAMTYQFHARDLHLVMGPTHRGSEAHFRVRLDGGPPGDAHGLDIDQYGYGILNEQRLYQLIRQPGAVSERTFTIEFAEPGVSAFAFTFG